MQRGSQPSWPEEAQPSPEPLLLGAGISEAAPTGAKGRVSCVWTIWPGFYIPQDFSITGLGRVEGGH